MPTPGERAWIGLGANLGEPRRTLEAAIAELAALPRTVVLKCSSFYRSAPIDAQGPAFVNAVVLLETELEPIELLDATRAIEARHGRRRPYPNAPRTLDLDLLLYGDQQLQGPRLTLPHPRLHLRAFALAPMLEIDPMLWAPGLGALAPHLAALPPQAIERLQ